MIIGLSSIFLVALFVVGLLLAVTKGMQDRNEWRKVLKIDKAVRIVAVLDFIIGIILLAILAGGKI